MISSIQINDIRVDLVDFEIIVNQITNAIVKKEKLIINYINAYTIVLALKNEYLKSALLNSNILHPDGIGIWLGSRILYRNKLLRRFNWTDYAYQFLSICEKNGWRIFFVGSTKILQNKAILNLKKLYPELQIVGTIDGYDDIENPSIINKISSIEFEILYVGMGTPKQELWIYKNYYLFKCPVIQAVGDLFSLFADEKIRGPLLFRKCGLEWLFRLINKPNYYFVRYALGIPRYIGIILKNFFSKNTF